MRARWCGVWATGESPHRTAISRGRCTSSRTRLLQSSGCTKGCRFSGSGLSNGRCCPPQSGLGAKGRWERSPRKPGKLDDSARLGGHVFWRLRCCKICKPKAIHSFQEKEQMCVCLLSALGCMCAGKSMHLFEQPICSECACECTCLMIAKCSCISTTATFFINCLLSLWSDVTLLHAAEMGPINRMDKSG